ncbi:uncharacterized protein K452DRAFT_337305 [Aplosporella prunicola CBS 121167]|uniref:Uncharacterized protein n=1 Tax=Aplosporella prunicola CBS 121167 TaxID=1176127 RepID=A0A6A6BS98_9PEZI|nr:uncharacterized protein K452DRAFT_337305 [Aplosporella prunicola CBS 121167]KAF2146972.1 hypothetical protein K452DRAFT_337305 [Aplosporella prunicola CBS 121167]
MDMDNQQAEERIELSELQVIPNDYSPSSRNPRSADITDFSPVSETRDSLDSRQTTIDVQQTCSVNEIQTPNTLSLSDSEVPQQNYDLDHADSTRRSIFNVSEDPDQTLTPTNFSTTISDTQAEANITKSDQGLSDPAWQPYTFRWQFFCLLTTYAVALLLLVILLYYLSAKNYGLVADDGSAIILFGWRFAPSLFAVIYVQLTAMLLNDIKRTEPFARMAWPGGAPGISTILRSPGAWWDALADGLSKKKSGRRSWILVTSALLNIIGFLAVSPLSPSLLEPKEVVTSNTVNFTRMVPKTDTAIHLDAGRETYLNVMAHILQNTSTSAWVSDDFSILPFWPSDLQYPALGPVLTTSPQLWRADTTVLSTELDCKPMHLTKITRSTVSNTTHGGYSNKTATNTDRQLISITLASDDGCKYSMANDLNYYHFNDGQIPLVESGDSFWFEFKKLNNSPWDSVVQSHFEKGNILTSFSKDCGDRELFFSYGPLDEANVQVSSYVCKAKYYTANMTVTASSSNGISETQFEHQEFLKQRTEMPEDFLNITEFQKVVPTGDWAPYMRSHPLFSGFSKILGDSYDYNLSTMIADTGSIMKAKKIRQRILGEMLLYALLQSDTSQEEYVQGRVIQVEKRIIVLSGVAITLSLILFVSTCLLLLTAKLSGSKSRPLGLSMDPSTTIGVASLIASGSNAKLDLQQLNQNSKNIFIDAMRPRRYYISQKALQQAPLAGRVEIGEKQKSKKLSDWRPFVLRLRTIIALVIFLIALLISVVILNDFSKKNLLYDKTFVYQGSVSILKTQTLMIAPFSTLPTLLAVVVGLWWGAMDTTFRRLQPYLSMAETPKPVPQGIGLSYESSYWIYAAIKSAWNRHWILSSLTLGTFLCSIFTITMSALLQRGTGIRFENFPLERNLRLRPVTTVYGEDFPTPEIQVLPHESGILTSLYAELSTNWLYSATIQATLNGSEPAWSRDGWSFIPLDLSKIPVSTKLQTDSNLTMALATNASLTTTAIRGRLECSPYEELNNISAWITEHHRTSDELSWKVGYEVGHDSEDDSGHYLLDTSILGSPAWPLCCDNDTKHLDKGSAIGYWSPNTWVYENSQHSMNFTTKWIYGKESSLIQDTYDEEFYLLFQEVPSMEALHCKPIIEKATAHISINRYSSRVEQFEILDQPVADDEAWEYVWLEQKDSPGSTSYTVRISYGVMFLDSMLAASYYGIASHQENPVFGYEDLNDMTFNFRDTKKGLNLDFMTYSMYSMVNKDPKALLDRNIMEKMANKTFSIFFQHFVSARMKGSYTYEQVNASKLSDLKSPAAVERKHFKRLHRDIECVADVLILVAGSDKLLQMIRERGVSGLKDDDRGLMAGLDWFKGSDGQMRWGVEIVEPEVENDHED